MNQVCRHSLPGIGQTVYCHSMLYTLLKVVFFALVAVYSGIVLWSHGSETINYSQQNNDIDWPNVLKDLVLVTMLVCSVTWVKHAWEHRHQGSTMSSRAARRKSGKSRDNFRVPR